MLTDLTDENTHNALEFLWKLEVSPVIKSIFTIVRDRRQFSLLTTLFFWLLKMLFRFSIQYKKNIFLLNVIDRVSFLTKQSFVEFWVWKKKSQKLNKFQTKLVQTRLEISEWNANLSDIELKLDKHFIIISKYERARARTSFRLCMKWLKRPANAQTVRFGSKLNFSSGAFFLISLLAFVFQINLPSINFVPLKCDSNRFSDTVRYTNTNSLHATLTIFVLYCTVLYGTVLYCVRFNFLQLPECAMRVQYTIHGWRWWPIYLVRMKLKNQ